MFKYALPAMALLISGCSAVAAVATVYTVGEIVSVATTDRTIDDHVSSTIKKQDCSVYRWFQGKEYCREIPPTPPPEKESKKYCYRSLGAVTCYTEPLKNQNDYLLNP